jgi:hypothetical protein
MKALTPSTESFPNSVEGVSPCLSVDPFTKSNGGTKGFTPSDSLTCSTYRMVEGPKTLPQSQSWLGGRVHPPPFCLFLCKDRSTTWFTPSTELFPSPWKV